MAVIEARTAMQHEEFLRERMKEVGHFSREIPHDPEASVTENLPDGTVRIRLGHNKHQSNRGTPTENAFAFDPKRVEGRVETVEPKNKQRRLAELISEGYILLYSPVYTRVAAYRPLPQASTTG